MQKYMENTLYKLFFWYEDSRLSNNGKLSDTRVPDLNLFVVFSPSSAIKWKLVGSYGEGMFTYFIFKIIFHTFCHIDNTAAERYDQ